MKHKGKFTLKGEIIFTEIDEKGNLVQEKVIPEDLVLEMLRIAIIEMWNARAEEVNEEELTILLN